VGRVLRPHGLEGELRVAPFSPTALNLAPGRFVYVDGRRRRIVEARPGKGAWLIRLSGISTREAAEAVHGMLLEAPDKSVERDDDESYFVHELVGLQVVTDRGEPVGELVEVLTTGSADVYVARGPRGEFLFPAIGDVVREIDLADGRMVITPMADTLDDSQ